MSVGVRGGAYTYMDWLSPTMDKESHAQLSLGWNHLAIFKH